MRDKEKAKNVINVVNKHDWIKARGDTRLKI
jgi:hypothetical protein